MKLKEQILKDTPFLPLYKFTLVNRSIQEANLLSFLIDADSYADIRLKDDIDFFQCTDNFIKTQLNISSPTIKKSIDNLVREGLIYVRIIKTDLTQARFVKINNDILIDMYTKYNSRDRYSNTDSNIIRLKNM